MRRVVARRHDDEFTLATGDRIVVTVPEGDELDLTGVPLEVDYTAFSATPGTTVHLRATEFCHFRPADLLASARAERQKFADYRDELAAFHQYRHQQIITQLSNEEKKA